MSRQRMVDPGARARSFAARRGGMLDTHKIRRELRQLHKRNAPVRSDALAPEEFMFFEEVDETPDADDDVIGRGFLQRNDGADDVLSVGITAEDGTPILVGLSTLGSIGDIAFVWTSRITGLAGIGGVALDASGNIYTYGSTSAPKYNASLVLQWTGFSPLVAPGHVTTDGTSAFYTDVDAGSGTNVVRKRLASTGAAGSPATFGSLGAGNGQFGSGGPIGIIFDGTSVWVVDTGNNRVQKFTASTGVYVSQFDGSSSGLAFAAPTGITIGPTSTHLYVLDAPNGRVVKFLKSTHAFVATFDLGVGNGDGQISADAEGIAVDSTGRIWIADTGNHRVQVFDSAGVYLGKIGSFGSGVEKFKSPKQIAVGSGDVIWIADSGNNRLVTLAEDTGGITPVITERVGGATALAAGVAGTATVTCSAGEVSISCGVTTNSNRTHINELRRSGTTGCTVTARNDQASGSINLSATAICMQVPIG